MCDSLVALGSASAGGATLFAKNSDRPPDETQSWSWLPARRDDHPIRVTHIDVAPHRGETIGCIVARPQWCWGAEQGVNEAGVAIGNEAIYTTLDPRTAPLGLTGMDLVRLGLERSSSSAAAVELIVDLLERYGQGGPCHDPSGMRAGVAYWSSFLIADPDAAFVVETSGNIVAIEAVAEVRAISNRTTIATFDAAHRHPRQPVERLTDPRLQASNRVLAHRPVTVAGLQQHLRSHDSCIDDGWSVCMHAAIDGHLVEVTASSLIAELKPHGASRAWVLLGHPCGHDYVQVPLREASLMVPVLHHLPTG
jgi:hypothetical protein